MRVSTQAAECRPKSANRGKQERQAEDGPRVSRSHVGNESKTPAKSVRGTKERLRPVTKTESLKPNHAIQLQGGGVNASKYRYTIAISPASTLTFSNEYLFLCPLHTTTPPPAPAPSHPPKHKHNKTFQDKTNKQLAWQRGQAVQQMRPPQHGNDIEVQRAEGRKTPPYNRISLAPRAASVGGATPPLSPRRAVAPPAAICVLLAWTG